ncbi:MAG: tyrosine-type recombinase/integrase [Thaumarchaeota archaeon]|nr:tyrosine-type recombinase/integrase [Nitrososphaerota archaeon]MCH9042097.1 tyrosine-type recombinase/integrase [Nitrososphaerota archaeon]
MESRCITIFENSCKTKSTFKSFLYFLDTYLKWSKYNYESLLELESTELENRLQDYVMYLKRRVDDGQLSPNTIPDILTAIFKFLKCNRKKFDRDVITQLYPDKIKLGGDRAITDDEIRQLLSFADIRDTAIIHLVSATGARPEAISELKMKHVEKLEDGFTKLILYADDFKHETITFLHPEATHAYNQYIAWRKRKGDKITDQSYLFSTITNEKKNPSSRLNVGNMQCTMHRLFQKAGIVRTKKGRRYDLATFTGFRKRFNTRLEMNSEISLSVIQCLMDHTGYLSRNYRKPTEEELLNEYKKGVNSLMISNEWKLKQELEEKKKENIVEKDKRISVLESTLKKQEIMLNELMKKL